MLAYLEGDLLYCGLDHVVCKVGGLGYYVTVGTRCAEALKTHVGPLSLWIEETVRDGQIHLFGFLNQEEITWFRWLLSVQGVGGKMALALLSTFSVPQLHSFILEGKEAPLRSAEGVGPKLAIRIVTELKDKALKWSPSSSFLSISTAEEEAFKALCALGYRPQEAEMAVSSVKTSDDVSTSDLIRLSLQYLAAARR